MAETLTAVTRTIPTIPTIPADSAPAPGGRRGLRDWFRRPPAPVPDHTRELRRLDEVRVVLERARTIVERGWLQNGWYVAQPRSQAQPRPQPAAHRHPVVDEISQACLVGAVAVAAHGGGGRVDVVAEAGPTMDVIWDALQESGGRSRRPAAGRAAPQQVRVSRMRDLVHWNDAVGRTRGEVLGLLDRAISHTILTAMDGPRSD